MSVDLDVVALVETFVRTDERAKPMTTSRKHLRAFPLEKFAALEALIVERSAENERLLVAQQRPVSRIG